MNTKTRHPFIGSLLFNRLYFLVSFNLFFFRFDHLSSKLNCDLLMAFFSIGTGLHCSLIDRVSSNAAFFLEKFWLITTKSLLKILIITLHFWLPHTIFQTNWHPREKKSVTLYKCVKGKYFWQWQLIFYE